MRVLIAGCGYVGTALGLRLAAEGHDVWGLRRQPQELPSRIRPLRADLTRPETLQDLPDGLEAVFYTASADRSDEPAYRAAYLRGLRCLLDALQRQGQPVRRVLFTSSTAVYGKAGGEWVDEDSPPEPADFRGAILLQAERLLLAGPFPAVVLRLGGIYGPGRVRRFLETVRRGQAVCFDGEPEYTNRIHRDDCAGALHHLMELDQPEPLYLGVDGDPAERCAVLRWLAECLGAPSPRVQAAPAGGQARTSKRCRNDRLLASGYRFLYPSFRQGYAELLAVGSPEDTAES